VAENNRQNIRSDRPSGKIPAVAETGPHQAGAEYRKRRAEPTVVPQIANPGSYTFYFCFSLPFKRMDSAICVEKSENSEENRTYFFLYC
jgi:hypothetical protein